MKRDYTKDGMPEYPDMLECPDPRLQLRLQTYAEVQTPQRDVSHVLAALALSDYEIGQRPEPKGPRKPKVLPEIWLPGQEFDPAALVLLLLKRGPVGNA
jgi:hypothetical protein